MKGTPPASVIRDGDLKASIWENSGKNGPYFTTTFAKTYRDRNNELRDTSVFNNSDLLRISELARQAYGRTNDLRRDMLNTQQQDHSQDGLAKRAEKFMQENPSNGTHQGLTTDQDHDLGQDL